MYKISVMDQNCPSGVSWLVSWFVDDIERFELESIVISDSQAEVCFEKTIILENAKIEIMNSYGSKWMLCMDWCQIAMRFIRFDGRYIRLAKYKAKGICVDRRKKHGTFSCAENFGNPVLKTKVSSGVYAQTTEPYREDTVESLVWYPINEYESYEEMETAFREMKEPYFDQEEFYELFWDIPGECG